MTFLLSFTSYSDSPFIVLRISCWFLHLFVCLPFVPSDYFLLLAVEEDTHSSLYAFQTKILYKKCCICQYLKVYVYLNQTPVMVLKSPVPLNLFNHQIVSKAYLAFFKKIVIFIYFFKRTGILWSINP